MTSTTGRYADLVRLLLRYGRFDLLPPAYARALTRLQDTATPFAFEQVKETVEAELGMRVKDLFSELDETPLAAASLGQVHRAVTRSGRDVVVKVQRPDVRETIAGDMEVLGQITGLLDRRTSIGQSYGISQLLAQFRRSPLGELDYRREAKNLLRSRELTAPYDLLVVPEPILQLTSSRVLTMERMDGRKVTDLGPLALLDLGMVATVPASVQTHVVKLLLAIGDGDGQECATILADMGHPLESYDAAAFRDDVTHLVSEAVASGADMEAGTVLVELSRRSGVRGLRPPAEMTMIGKALLNLDQATTHLDLYFSPAQAIRDNVSEIFAASLKTTPGGMLAAAIEAKEFTALLPKRANRILDALAAGELQVTVDTLDEQRLHIVLQCIANRVTLGLVIAATIVGTALMTRVETSARILGFPAIAMIFFMIAVVAAALGLQIVLGDRKVARQETRRHP